jgi:hypothetical protein
LVHEVVQLDEGLISRMRSSLWLSRLVDPTVVTRDVVAKVEETIAQDLDCPPHWVFLTIESDKNPLYSPPGWDPTPGDIIIEREQQSNERFQELSDIWRNTTSAPSYTYVSLFTNRSEARIDHFAGWTKLEWADFVLRRLDDVIPQ